MEDFQSIQLFSPGTCEAIDLLHEDDLNNILQSVSFDMDAVLQHMSSGNVEDLSTAAQPPVSGDAVVPPLPDVVDIQDSLPSQSPPPSPSRAELVRRAQSTGHACRARKKIKQKRSAGATWKLYARTLLGSSPLPR